MSNQLTNKILNQYFKGAIKSEIIHQLNKLYLEYKITSRDYIHAMEIVNS